MKYKSVVRKKGDSNADKEIRQLVRIAKLVTPVKKIETLIGNLI